jgi:RND family efflux transporter MFP subunit
MTIDPKESDRRSAEKISPLPPPRRVFAYVVITVVGLIGSGIYGHWQRAAEAARTQDFVETYVPTVRVALARRDNQPLTLVLPGQTEAFDSAAIHARATGYIAERRVDIGSRVHKGDLLLRISAPDLDAQLAQAQAQLEQFQASANQAAAQVQQAMANAGLAKVTNARTAAMAADGWQTRQEADNTLANLNAQSAGLVAAQAMVRVAAANVDAQRATVNRLEQLTTYEQVTAPFDGVVTARSADVGDLVSADANGGTPLFTIQNDNMLRVSVQVPQSGAVGIADGLDADVSVPELSTPAFHGKVARSSVSLSNQSRTMTVEVDIPNTDHRIRAGLYVNVALAIPRATPSIVVPDEALVFDAKGEHVFAVDHDNRVAMRPVSITRDFGTDAEIASGLTGGEQVVLSPPANLADGATIRLSQDQPQGSRQASD